VTRTTTTLDAALEAALDARRDPLFDEAVLAALVLEPERFGEVERLSRGVLALAHSARPPARRGLRRHVPLALVALTLVGVAFIAWWPKSERTRHPSNDADLVDALPAPAVQVEPTPALAPTSARDRIASLVLSVEVARDDDVRRTALVVQPGGSRHVVESASRLVNGRIEQIVTSQTPLP
jgi:hypothetical protein